MKIKHDFLPDSDVSIVKKWFHVQKQTRRKIIKNLCDDTIILHLLLQDMKENKARNVER